MPDVELARRPDVELVKTGSWATMTGSWNPTPEDLAAAVEAQSCPGVRRPVVKLGHVDSRFDGEPALGWFENLRLADNGATLVGDQVTLPWLHSVQAAAYPSRSVEGNYNHTCGSGHKHKFVLTAVALLGVTPPAVKTIRNLNDLPAMLGVAASEPEVPDGAEHVQVTIMAGRHTFDEHKIKRDGDGKFSHTASTDSDAKPAPKTSSAEPAPLKDSLKLAGRIKLGDGETLTGSGAIKNAGIAVAAIDGPDGPRVRLGVGIDPGDISRWRAADKGATVQLDADGVAALQAAIPEIVDIAAQGVAHYKALQKRDRDLTAQERELVNRQYPKLSKADAKKLEQVDSATARLTSRSNTLAESQRRRVGDLPDDKQRERATDLLDQVEQRRQAGDDSADLQVELRSIMWGRTAAEVREIDELLATPLMSRTPEQNQRLKELRTPQSGLAFEWPYFFDRDLAQQDDNAQELSGLAAERGRLTADSRPLSDTDAAELARVRQQLDSNSREWGEFEDGGFLLDGVIPGTWGDLVYEVTMSGERPRIDVDVRPPDAGPDWYGGAGDPVELADLRKLPALLGRAAAVKASASQDGDTEVHTGAMIALIPTVEDAERLALEGGEPAEELHLTIAYLGEVAALGDKGQQDVLDAVSSAANGMPIVEAELFATSAFNPHSDEWPTCQVYLASSALLDAVNSMVASAITASGAPVLLQDRSWIPHITAMQTDEPIAAMTERLGAVTFDRLRLAFGGQVLDIPLIDYSMVDAGPEPTVSDADVDMVAAAGVNKSLKSWWLTGPGKSKWSTWTELYHQIRKHVNPKFAKRIAAQWFHDRYGYWPGDKRNQGVKASEEAATPPILPAAEPEPVNTDPKEDLVSTDLSPIGSRLGLDGDVNMDSINEAIDALKAKAEKTPEPTPEMVAASAAATEKATKAEAEKDELRKEVSVLASQMQTVTAELSAAKAAQAATVKASVLDAAVKDGKLKPADREQWEKDYDEAPGAITRVLASIAPGTAVPVMASGTVGSAEPTGDLDDEYEHLTALLDGPHAKAV